MRFTAFNNTSKCSAALTPLTAHYRLFQSFELLIKMTQHFLAIVILAGLANALNFSTFTLSKMQSQHTLGGTPPARALDDINYLANVFVVRCTCSRRSKG